MTRMRLIPPQFQDSVHGLTIGLEQNNCGQLLSGKIGGETGGILRSASQSGFMRCYDIGKGNTSR